MLVLGSCALDLCFIQFGFAEVDVHLWETTLLPAKDEVERSVITGGRAWLAGSIFMERRMA